MDARLVTASGQVGLPRQDPMVVIVGGGIAGVSAARHLINRGVQQVLILEAKDRLGGRIHTVTGDSGNVDYGAQYIHGQDENPLYQLALQHDLIVSPSSKLKDTTNKSITAELYGNEFRTDNGDLVPKNTVRDVNEVLEEAYEKCNCCLDNASTNKSIGHHFETRFEDYLQSCADSENDVITKRGVFDWRIRWELHDNSCLSLFDATNGNYQNTSGDYFIDVRGGFQSIFHSLLNDIPPECVRTGTPVSRIHWRGEENSGRSRKCTVETKHGGNVNCYYVIVTVPLGVLQTNINTLFCPTLPQSKKEALCRRGFGSVVKIFLSWTEPFWENSFEGIQFVWTCSADKSKDRLPKNTLTKKNGDPWWRDIDGFHVLKENPRTLLGWMGGEGARLTEDLSEEEILHTCHLLLQQFAPHLKIPKPQAIKRTQWLSDEYTQGGFSYISTYNKPGDTEEMVKPLPSEEDPTLLFAGEAMSHHHFSTTHGAHETGIQAANIILQNEAKKNRTQNDMSSFSVSEYI